MTKIKDVIKKGQPIPDNVTDVADVTDDHWKLNEPLGWYCTRYWDEAPPTNPSLYFDDGLRLSTAWGPLTVTAVREPEPPRCPECGCTEDQKSLCRDDWHQQMRAEQRQCKREACPGTRPVPEPAESGCRHYDRLLATLGAENVTTALAEIERLKADASDPLVLSLPQVPPGTQALIGGTTGERYNSVAVDGSWRPDTDDPDGFGLNLAEVLEREGSVTVVKRGPRAWPKIDKPDDDDLPQTIDVDGYGRWRRSSPDGVLFTDGTSATTMGELMTWGDVTEVFDDEPRIWPRLDSAPEDLEAVRGVSGMVYRLMKGRWYADDASAECDSLPSLQNYDGPLTEVLDDKPGGAS